MSIINQAKEFFGLTPPPVDYEEDYYDEEPRYRTHGSAAYAPERREYERSYEPVAPVRNYAPTVVSVEVTSFNDCSLIGNPFRDGDAVVFDITGLSKADRRRVVDFAAGLCMGLRGKMHKLSKKGEERVVFALSSENSHISETELERAAALR